MIKIVVLSKYGEHLDIFFKSIVASQPDWKSYARIVVVDDGVDRDIKEKLSGEGVVFVDGVQPFVFSRNVNIGAKTGSKKDDILLLGDDITILTPNFLKELTSLPKRCDAISFLVDAGAVANYQQQWCHGDEFVDVRRIDSDLLVLTCVWIQASVWWSVGGMDERFVGYGFEDNDWSRRAIALGYRLGVTPKIKVKHGIMGYDASTSFKRSREAEFNQLYHQNWLLFQEKYGVGKEVKKIKVI